MKTLVNPLFVAMENNPKLIEVDMQGTCAKKKKKHLCWTYTIAMWVKCEQCKRFLFGKILGFFLKCVMKAWNFMVENLGV
jgi:hypothetical protein